MSPFPKNLEQWTQFVIGLAIISFGVIKLFFGTSIFSPDRMLEIILGILLLLLAASYASAKQRAEDLQKLSKQIEAIGNAEIAYNPEDLYKAAERVIMEAPQHSTLRATDFRLSDRKQEKTGHTEYIDKLKTLLKGNKNIRYFRAALSNGPQHDEIKEITESLKQLPANNVEQIEFDMKHNPLDMNVIISEDRVLLAFPRGQQLRQAIIIRGKDIAHAFREWYDGTIWSSPNKKTL